MNFKLLLTTGLLILGTSALAETTNATTSPFATENNINSDSISTTPQTDTLQQDQGLTPSTSSATTTPNFNNGPAQTVPVNPSAIGPGSSSGTAPINPSDAQ